MMQGVKREANQNECCGFRGEGHCQQLGDVGVIHFAVR